MEFFYKKLILFIISGLSCFQSFSQDSLYIRHINFDSSLIYSPKIDFNSGVFKSYFEYEIIHDPSEEDKKIYKKYKDLHLVNPSTKNYKNYFNLACSLWELNYVDESEKMFLKILKSIDKFYTQTYLNGSDIPGDKSTNSYGYGSFSSNYKNSACHYLCKINIEKKNFHKALEYFDLIIEKYPVYYSCGTGNNFYQGRLKKLKTLCLEGLGEYNQIIDLYLKDYSDSYCANLVNAIKKTYTQEQINFELTNIENSFSLVLDSFPSQIITYENYGKKNQIELVSEYISGEAKITLFGRELILQRPYLEEGEIVCKDDFLNKFKETPFFENLLMLSE
jgi:hypothetical protein